MSNEAAARKSQEPSSAIDALRPRFLHSLQQRRLVIRRILAAFVDRKFKANDINELMSITHKLRGSAASYFYKELSFGAGILEDCLKQDDAELNYTDVIDHTEQLLRLCDNALDNDDAANTADNDTPLNQAGMVSDKEPATSIGLSRPASILLVEDDPATQALITAIVKNDATVSFADTIAHAISFLEKDKPDLIIVDNNLACGGTGIDLVRHLSAGPQSENIPVIMMTASSEPADHIRAMLGGVVDFVVKPIVPQEFSEKIRKFLHAQQFTVLIADDNDGVRALLMNKFREQAVNAIEAKNFDELLRMIAEHEPDLILTDCALNDLDLKAVIQQSHSKSPASCNRVVLLTAIQNENEILELLNLGAVDYIAKQFNADIVVARCMRLIDLKEPT